MGDIEDNMIVLFVVMAFLAAAMGLYIFGFIFIHGSSPGKNKAQDQFIDETCAPNGLLRTVLTWGYAKATWRRFKRYYASWFITRACQDQQAPDAKLIALDGKECLLLRDFVLPTTLMNIPLILNMGSMT